MAYRYMILDSRSTTLARGLLDSPLDAKVWYIKVLDGGESRVMEHEYLQLVGLDEGVPAKSGRMIRQKDNMIVLEPMDDLGNEAQQNLRVPVKFSTYIYPLTGKWIGRQTAISHDLSCGGIAFSCAAPLEEKELLEIVIPITGNPLVLKAQVLRQRPTNADVRMYSAKFINLVREEEAMVCEAVFSQQILNRSSSNDMDNQSEF